MTDIVALSLRIDAGTEVVVECGVMTLMRTGEIGCCGPELAERHIAGTKLIGDTDTEKALPSLAEKWRLRRLNHALPCKDILPLLLTSKVVEKGCCQLTEIAPTHLNATDILHVIELQVLLFLSKTEGFNGLCGIILLEGVVMLQAEGLTQHGTVGGIGPRCHRRAAGLIHHRPIGTRIGNTLRIGLAIADGQEEIDLITGLVDQVGDTVSTLADAQIVVDKATAGKDIGQQHIIDIADMSQMAIPIESIRMATTNDGIYRIAWQTVLPEDRGFGLLEVRLVPHIGTQCPPFGAPRGEVGLVDNQILRVFIGYKLWLTGNGPYMLRILRLTEAHVIIATNRIAIRLKINIGRDIKVHATAHILDDQTIAAGDGTSEIDIPHISADQCFLASLLLRSSSRFPKLHRTHILL